MSSFEANGARFIAENDMIVRWCRKEQRPFEPETTAFIFDVMKDGGQFVDVGAATGWFSIPLALRGCRSVAFEPNCRVFDRLKANIALNEVEALVEAMPVAVSNTMGTATFWHNPDVPLTSGGSIEAPTCRRPLQETVRTVTLDMALVGLVAKLIKIDVEGHERLVLDGARRVIAEHRPHLVLEANTPAAHDILAAWLDENGYTWTAADERNMLCRPC